ncbi:MAG TPA: ABC transporter substrate-binding protein [Casimicrobiaceae bacterium]|nr:ABC transporter substrate-binding protein [Casimicrobiaceae bacterium]
MQRRTFMGILALAACARPPGAAAQSSERPRRIGVLMAYAQTDAEAVTRVTAFVRELQRLGWTVGQNLHIDYRWAGGDAQQIAAHSAELVKSQPSAIFAATTPVVRALLRETRTIPIVFVSVSDPVGDRFVEGLARPGGNATGFINIESSMAGKWVELLKAIAPHVTRVSIVFNPTTAAGAGAYFQAPFESAARAIGLEPRTVAVQDPSELDRAIASLGAERTSALIVMPDSFNVVHRDRIIAAAAQHRLPAVYPYRYMATAGGLMSYGVDLLDMYVRGAIQVDRILRGADPREMPIQVPTKFEFVINRKTAEALGLAIPQTMLLRADEVIK